MACGDVIVLNDILVNENGLKEAGYAPDLELRQ